jgi:hypothetical protein
VVRVSGDLFTLRIIGLPLDEQVLASQHFDELLREFSYLHADDGDGTGVPARLINLRDELVGRFHSFTARSNLVRDEAVQRGDATIDLAFEIPRAAADAATHLGALLDEADDFCRSGEHLLTLATADRTVRFRRWYLGEFARQASGETPKAWSDAT